MTAKVPAASFGDIDPYITDHRQPTKLVTLLVQGRNDDYLGNFKWRLSTVLNNHARNLETLELGPDEVEILLTDWGSERPLYKDLDLTEAARRMIKFLIVSPEVAAIYNKDYSFASCIPINCGARRANGRYLLFSDSDVFIPLQSFARLMHHLRQGVIHEYSLEDTFFLGLQISHPE